VRTLYGKGLHWPIAYDDLRPYYDKAQRLPAAQVVNNLPEETAARLELAKTEGLEIFRAAGALEVWTSGRNAEHLVGGTPMGNDPDQEVNQAMIRKNDGFRVYICKACITMRTYRTVSALEIRYVGAFRTPR